MKKSKTPVTVLLSRIRREIGYLKSVLRENEVAIPQPLADLLAAQLPKTIDSSGRRLLRLCRRQERELRALRDGACPQSSGSVKPQATIWLKKRRAGSGVSRIYDSLERGGFPVVGGMIESNHQKH